MADQKTCGFVIATDIHLYLFEFPGIATSSAILCLFPPHLDPRPPSESRAQAPRASKTTQSLWPLLAYFDRLFSVDYICALLTVVQERCWS